MSTKKANGPKLQSRKNPSKGGGDWGLPPSRRGRCWAWAGPRAGTVRAEASRPARPEGCLDQGGSGEAQVHGWFPPLASASSQDVCCVLSSKGDWGLEEIHRFPEMSLCLGKRSLLEGRACNKHQTGTTLRRFETEGKFIQLCIRLDRRNESTSGCLKDEKVVLSLGENTMCFRFQGYYM